jgi:hypothetical protein
MAGQIDEEVLGNFIVSEDDFKDLDAIVRRHCETVRYYVYKGSALGGYDMDDVEVLLKERNGSGTKIESVMLHATGSDGLKFNVDFHDNVGINGECADRASLVLLATETRGLIRDRMKGVTPQRRNILYAVAAIFFFVGYLAFQQYQISYANSFNATQTTKTNRADAAYRQKENAAIVPTQTLLSQAVNALSKHDLSAEVGVLLQQQIEQWRQQIIFNEEPTIAPLRPPSWSISYWLAVAVGCATAAAAVGIVGYLVLPSSGSVFLIGDEKRRQERAKQLRANIKWVIIAGIIVSVVSGLYTISFALESSSSATLDRKGQGYEK